MEETLITTAKRKIRLPLTKDFTDDTEVFEGCYISFNQRFFLFPTSNFHYVALKNRLNLFKPN